MILDYLNEEISEQKIAKEFNNNYKKYFNGMSDAEAEQLFLKIVALDPDSYSRNDPEKLEKVGQAASGNGILMKDWINGNRDFISDEDKCTKIKDSLKYFYSNRAKFAIKNIAQYSGIDSFLNAVSGDGEVVAQEPIKKALTPDEKMEEKRAKYFSNIPDLDTYKKIAYIDPNSDIEHGQTGAAAQFLIEELNRNIELLNTVLENSFLIKCEFIKLYSNGFNNWRSLQLKALLDQIDSKANLVDVDSIIEGDSKLFTALRYACDPEDYIVWATTEKYAIVTPLKHKAAAILDTHWYTDETKSNYFAWLDRWRAVSGRDQGCGQSANTLGSCYINRWCTGYSTSYWNNSTYRDISGKHYLVCFIDLVNGNNPKNNAQASMIYNEQLKRFAIHKSYGVLTGEDTQSNTCVDDGAKVILDAFVNNPALLAQCNAKANSGSIQGCTPIRWTEVYHDYEDEDSDRVTMIGKHLMNRFEQLNMDATSDQLKLPKDVLLRLAEPYTYSGETLTAKDIFCISELHISPSINKIPDFAFENAPNLLKIVIPSSVTSIGSAAFRRCNKLVDVILNEGLETIGYNAFDGCIALSKAIKLPDSIRSIKAGAFLNTAARFSLSRERVTSEIPLDIETLSVSDENWYCRANRFVIR